MTASGSRAMAEKKDGCGRGEKNSITDVRGVKVAHLTIQKDLQGPKGQEVLVRTGLTAVVPYSMEKPLRLFCGSLSLKGSSEMTGLEVMDDFCYLNSPIVIANSYNVGKAYNAILSYGFALNRDEIWPPLIIGINDSYLNEMTGYTFAEKDILEALFKATEGQVEEGSVGVGLGLKALDWKGGVGTASRKITLGRQEFICGALAASNHGNSDFKEGSLTLVIAVDIPLLPHQIDQVLRVVAASLGPVHLQRNMSDAVAAVLFSTANAMSLVNGGPFLFDYQAVDDSWLEKIIQACSETVAESILNSLAKAKPVLGKMGRAAHTMPAAVLSKLLKNSGG